MTDDYDERIQQYRAGSEQVEALLRESIAPHLANIERVFIQAGMSPELAVALTTEYGIRQFNLTGVGILPDEGGP